MENEKKRKDSTFLRVMKISAALIGTGVCVYSVTTCLHHHQYVRLLHLITKT